MLARKRKTKALITVAILLLSSIVIMSLKVKQVLAEQTPTVSIKIYRIQAVDPIEGFLQGEADWYYEIKVWDGTKFTNKTAYAKVQNQDDVIEDKTHDFEDIESTVITVYIYLYEDDGIFGFETADISGSSYRTTFFTTYNLKQNTISGDQVIIEGGYYKTSGDYDGSTDVDENDANLWFDIWDNYDAPNAYAGEDVEITAGDKVNFDGSGSTSSPGSSIAKYEWDFENDGIIDAEGEKASYTYTKEGVYSYRLRVTDSLGEWDEDTGIVNVSSPPNKPPKAKFVYVPANPTIQDVVSFVDQSSDPDGSITSWLWDFGDGTTSQDSNPEHQYSNKGDYTITLTVTDNGGAQNSTEKILTIDNIPPIALFTYSPTELMVGEDVQFIDESTDPEGEPLSRLWNFGDGHTSTAKNPAHKYQSKGTYEVTLTVTDDEGLTNDASKTITVLNKPPTASFTYTPTKPTIQDTISFLDTSQDPYGSVVSWFWNFGDATNSTSQNSSHTFAQKGSFVVTLTVTDDDGAQSSFIQTVVVYNIPPDAYFNYSPTNPRTNTDVQFSDRSTDPENRTFSCLWDFGDGYTSDLQNPSHNFASKGDYNVTLTVWDDENATDTFSMTVSVTEPPPPETTVPIPLWMIVLVTVVIFGIGISTIYVWSRHRRSTKP